MISNRKGIILAGGHATRLRPATTVISKQLLPIYDKPMIYYPLSTLMSIGIKDILIISDPNNLKLFKSLLGNGKKYGVNFKYAVQKKPRGLADALLVGEKFLNNSCSALILGDNIFYGSNLEKILKSTSLKNESTIFGYPVKDPQRYGVAKFNKKNKLIKIIEKPKKPPSNLAIPGLYFYDEEAPKIAKKINPSKRGELEISDLNNFYIKNKKMNIVELNKEMTWLDTGTFESYYDACEFVKVLQNRQGVLIFSPELIAYKNGWISKKELIKISKNYPNNYGKILKSI